MAVHTQLTTPEIKNMLSQYGIEQDFRVEAVAGGIENSNFFIYTDKHGYILTLFEEIEASSLNFYLSLLQHLQSSQVSVAAPLVRLDKALFGLYRNNTRELPFALFPKLQGRHVDKANAKQCQKLGKELAKFHLATQSYPARADTDIRSLTWLKQLLDKWLKQLPAEQQKLGLDILQQFEALYSQALPQSIIHRDLFRDNCLFDGDELSGIIDVFNAGYDLMIYDLAIVINDWARTADNTINTEQMTAIIKGYESIRELEGLEKEKLHLVMQLAALRYWCSRLESGDAKPHEEFKKLFIWLNDT